MLQEIMYWWGTRKLRQECSDEYRELMGEFMFGTLGVPLDEAVQNLKERYIEKGLLRSDVDLICSGHAGWE